ncbi:MAG: ester cyclase [Ardenticatenaceae bacterium]|nr:ester cyclase [Anaerolineales bacterium]MCB8916460.1 ester cyclase [Ardenticatenaceae bacterium]
MSVEQNKALVAGWYEAINSPDWEIQARPFISDLAVWKGFVDLHRPFREAFPDYHAEIEGLIGEGDHVAVWTRVTGTFSKPFEAAGMSGIEPQGQKLAWPEAVIYDFGEGVPNIVYWGVDELGRLRQLGALA